MPYVNYNKLTPWTKEMILEKLATDDTWVERALVTLYHRQKQTEQYVKQTVYDNEIGFQPADARYFTIFAEKLLRGEHLNASELRYARRPWHRGKRVIPAIAKYRGQILEVIEAAAAKKKMQAGAQ